MTIKEAEIITAEYMKPLYSFALKRCVKLEDAEDLTQDICLKLFRSLLVRDDISDVAKYVWTIAHNTLVNYYRKKQTTGIGVSIDELADILPSEDDIPSRIIEEETRARFQSEIAYLSKLQRQIIISYYYENKKQGAIATELNVPLGTVKWHLFESKKELQKGMETMRQSSELKFNPIRFSLYGYSGSTGTMGDAGRFFRSSLAQNIAYCVSKQAKTINEIAAELGVSPVYVESEVEFLEEYCFLNKHGNKFIINFLLEEANETIIAIMDEMYEKAAKLFANELYDELHESSILNDANIVCCNRMIGIDEENKLPIFENDKNFLLWSLIPYITAFSGENIMDKRISFEEAYTIRPDGGKNIFNASVENSLVPKYFDGMKKFHGPFWNGLSNKFILWTIDSEWSEKRVDENYQATIGRNLSLFERFFNDEELSDYEYACMAEKGYMRKYSSEKGTWLTLQVAWIRNEEAKKIILSFGDRIKEKYKDEFNALKAPYIKAILDITPKHLYKMRMYGLQNIFYSDGWFILHCMKALVNNGKLKLPSVDQKKSLTTIIAPNS